MVQAPCFSTLLLHRPLLLTSHISMGKEIWKRCPFSGMTNDLWLVKPIPDLSDDVDEMQVWSFTPGPLHPSPRA